MNVGQTINRLRTARRMSQGDLADALEVSRQSISKWETGASVPELEKLVKLAELFDVSLDELVRGEDAEKAAQAEQSAAPVQVVVREGVGRKTVALVLLCFGGLVCLLLTVMGGFFGGLLFASPFLVCGVICLVFAKNTGLWCAWALLFLTDVYLRYATGITWGLTALTFVYEPSMNYMRLLIAWAGLLCFIALFVVTILHFRKKPIAPTRKVVVPLAVGWVICLLLHTPLPTMALFPLDPFSFAANFLFHLLDWIKIALFAVLAVFTARVICGWQESRK
ncbi:MAG: helix-turn-helix domain-containing protein [Oscillospiraceae bacterium]|nr:helix-turn-helix domain-containing protein [Oscillospiraceae bacterium]